jgi:endonuclease/exonuclease/phosphatase family metal-dependent hydrolase
MLAVRPHPDKRLRRFVSALQRMGAVGISSDRRSALWIVLASAILCLGVLISVGLSSGSGRSGNAANDSQTVTVMTRNIYLGGNIDRPIRAALDRTGPEGVLALGHANHELRNVVDRTDFGTRSGLLANEIAAARPDLIGLQEVALWRHGPLQLDQIGLPNATEVDNDFLATLVADLATRGIRYDIVGVQQQSDVEAPAFTGNPFAGAAGSAEDVRLTDRDVILVRSGSGVHIEATGGGHYSQQFTVRLGETTVPFVRGYAWADVAVASTRLRFITTHLESQSAKLAQAQAEELLNGPAANPNLSTVIACDCNSNPASPAAHSPLRIGSGAAYRLITNDHGYSDLWLQQRGRAGPGNTASLGELVNNPRPRFERRIDLVLARPASPTQVVVERAEVTGDEPNDQDPVSKLWPSDHAGVLVQLRIG